MKRSIFCVVVLHLLAISRSFRSVTWYDRTYTKLAQSLQSDGDEGYTLQYSSTFHRHVLRKGPNVLRSYLWLDQAIRESPQAKLLPVEAGKWIAGARNLSTTTCGYPVLGAEHGETKQAIYDVFQTELQWYSSQVDHVMSHHKVNLSVEELQERFRFLLAPLPGLPVLEAINYTEYIDWPYEFYRNNRGAGMSIAQVSHALLALPHFLLSRPASDISLVDTSPFLYSQTPPAVMVITHEQLKAWLVGAQPEDGVALSWLHWKGWEWTTFRVLLHAWPSLLKPSLETSWEVFERGSNVAERLKADLVSYLQTRLQLRPWHIQAMCKTHSRLTGYKLELVQRNLDFMQDELGLQSGELRSIVLSMPSLLGASVSSMQARIQFWRIDVGVPDDKLNSFLLPRPALLQYSVANNLNEKLKFFKGELRLDQEQILKMTLQRPDMWSYSLRDKLQSSAKAFVGMCGDLDMQEYGQIVGKAPALLCCSWAANLSRKLHLLKDTFDYSGCELKIIMMSTPRVLLQPFSSLQRKAHCLSTRLPNARTTVLSKPNLLLSSVESLNDRIRELSGDRREDVLLSRKKSRRVRVLEETEYHPEGKVLEFANAAEAATFAGTSVSNMYNVLRKNRLLHGRQYSYFETSAPQETPQFEQPVSSPTKVSSSLSALEIQVSGCAFPPETGVRGRRRAGGMALHIPNFALHQWKEICNTLWQGRRYKFMPKRRSVILGYPYTRPSTPRSQLYVCLEAIRVATLWFKTVETSDATVSILVDGSYALDLLEDTDRILSWGEAETLEDFHYTGSGPLYRANPDILFPISRSLYHLYNRETQRTASSCIKVQFSSFCKTHPVYNHTRNGARTAARLMYNAES